MPPSDVGKVTSEKKPQHRAELSSVLILPEPLTFLLSAGDISVARAPQKPALPWQAARNKPRLLPRRRQMARGAAGPEGSNFSSTALFSRCWAC